MQFVRRIAPGKILKMHHINRLPPDSVSETLFHRADSLVGVLGDVQFAVLFGSAVTGALREDSDIDLAVMYPSPLDSDRLIRLVAEISVVFGKPVDLVDLRRAGPIIKMQVLQNGRPVIINDRGAFERFRMYTPSEYFDFKLCRRPVEENLKAWGAS